MVKAKHPRGLLHESMFSPTLALAAIPAEGRKTVDNLMQVPLIGG